MLPNLTLVIQGLAFFAVAWLVMKFIWPPIMAAIEERQQKIAEGLAAADNAQKNLAQAEEKANDELKAARAKANEIIDQAHRRGTQIVEAAKAEAITEGLRQKARGLVWRSKAQPQHQGRRPEPRTVRLAAQPGLYSCQTGYRSYS